MLTLFICSDNEIDAAGKDATVYQLENTTTQQIIYIHAWSESHQPSVNRYVLHQQFAGKSTVICGTEISCTRDGMVCYYIDCGISCLNPAVFACKLYSMHSKSPLGSWVVSQNGNKLRDWDITANGLSSNNHWDIVAVHDPRCGVMYPHSLHSLTNFANIDRERGTDPISIAVRQKIDADQVDRLTKVSKRLDEQIETLNAQVTTLSNEKAAVDKSLAESTERAEQLSTANQQLKSVVEQQLETIHCLQDQSVQLQSSIDALQEVNAAKQVIIEKLQSDAEKYDTVIAHFRKLLI